MRLGRIGFYPFRRKNADLSMWLLEQSPFNKLREHCLSKCDHNAWCNIMTHVVYCLDIMGPVISDYNKRLILLSVIQLGNGHWSLYKQ